MKLKSSAEIKKIVNLFLGATASGSISLTYERTDTFSGPQNIAKILLIKKIFQTVCYKHTI